MGMLSTKTVITSIVIIIAIFFYKMASITINLTKIYYCKSGHLLRQGNLAHVLLSAFITSDIYFIHPSSIIQVAAVCFVVIVIVCVVLLACLVYLFY